MQKCLGIYIENNLIKYAKIAKDRDQMKVETFGIRFYENLQEEINKIIEETYSFRDSTISVNLSNEKYLYFDAFALLTKKDIDNTIKTEFQSFCEEKNFNINAIENRYALMPNIEDKEKVRAIDIYINKNELSRQVEPLEKYKLTKIMPTAIAIGNIARIEARENALIVNMEETTTVTTIYDKQIYAVDTLDVGSKEILDEINAEENSYAKAYDICKNTTIYTAETEIYAEEQPYLSKIMPVIYKITEKVQEIITNSANKIQTIYLTGNLSTINNIDLYFQEFFGDIECKILKPNIVNETVTKINIKDYVEVNSAIALATVGLGEGIQELNFGKEKAGSKLSQALTLQIGEKTLGPKENINMSFGGKLTVVEQSILTGIIGIILLFATYTGFSVMLSKQMNDKETEISTSISNQQKEISKVNSEKKSLDSKTNKYNELTAQIKRINEKISDDAARRNAIPNLLNQIMFVIPEDVKLVSIENSKDDTITIEAQAYKYEQLGYFITALKTKEVLKDVVSSRSSKSGNIVSVTIEGELP